MFIEDLVNEMKDILKLDDFFKEGGHIFDISAKIKNEFNDFFSSKSSLDRYANDYLISDWVNYLKYSGRTTMKQDIIEIIEMFNKAKEKNDNKTFEMLAMHMKDAVQVGDKYWSFVFLEKDRNELKFYEYVTVAFESINSISETAIKCFLTLIVAINRIKRNKSVEYEKIVNMKFGSMVNELVQTSNLGRILSDCGYGVSVSQWRNIACHKNYCINGEKIVCNYGTHLENEVTLNKEELLSVNIYIAKIARILNFAVKFFTYDNNTQIAIKYETLRDEVVARGEINQPGRDETWLLIFVSKLVANGFEPIDIEIDVNHITLKIKELTNLDYKWRVAQTPKIIYNMWNYSNIKEGVLEVIYSTKEGIPYLNTVADCKDCALVDKGKEDFEYLINNCKFMKIGILK